MQVLACLVALIKAFSLHQLWPLTDTPQFGVFKILMIVKSVSCQDNITGLKDTHGKEGSTPYIIIIQK